MDNFWQILLGNLAMVALVMSLWTQAQPWLEARMPLSRETLFGFVMGLGTVLSMVMSVQVQPGIYFDLRHALIAMSGLFGGAVPVLIAGVMAGTYRLAMGGSGIAFGMTGIVAVMVVSLTVRALIHRREATRRDVVTLSAAVTITSFLIAISRFSPVEQMDFVKFTLPVAALNFASVCICGLILVAVRDYSRDRDLARFALAQSPSFYYIKDRDSRFRIVNQAVAQLNGFECAGGMRGLSDFDLTTPERALALMAEERAVMETGNPVLDKQEKLDSPFGPKWYTTTKIAVRTEKGDVIGIAGVTHDITARKIMEQELVSSRMHLDYAMREMSDGLALFSSSGDLIFCNDQYQAFFPMTAHVRVPGSHIRDILAAVLETGEQLNIPTEQGEAWIDDVASGLLVDNDQEIRTHAGGWLQIRTRKTQDGSALVVVTDMTVMKESEIALRHLTDQLRSLAETDGLTGLINRRVFDIRLDAAMEGASEERPLSLLMLDVDRFKAYNDRYGHSAGDECLKVVAECLRQLRTRPSDVVARYGGEEFAVILPNTDTAGALAVAERLQRLVAERNLPHAGSELGKVTLSIGIGTLKTGQAPSSLVDLADEALYKSKEAGRHRITAA